MKRMQRVFGDLDALRYVDGRLDPDRKAAFLSYLADDPEGTERVAMWSRQNETLRAAFAGVALESIPPALRLGHVPPPRVGAPVLAEIRPAPTTIPAAPPRGKGVETSSIAYLGWSRGPGARRRDLRLPLSAAVLLGLAMLIVYVAHGLLAAPTAWSDAGMPTRPAGYGSALNARAADAFATYALDTAHPVEFTAAQIGTLSGWLKRRIGVSVEPADLSPEGFTLLGGRLVTALDQPGGFFVYEDRDGDRLGLLVTREPSSGALPTTLASQEGGSASMSWSSRAFAYALVTGRSVDWLSRNGEALKERVGQPTGE